MRLVSFLTQDGLKLKGILCRAVGSTTTILHVHGSCGNFYENDFVESMSEFYPAKGINFLSFNNRGHDCIAEGYRNKSMTYIGGALEYIDECDFDIAGAVEFAKHFSSRVVLQGHSLGCLKVLMYLVKHGSTCDAVLLSPSDPLELQSRYIHPESLAQQKARIRTARSDFVYSLLSKNEYGVANNGVSYPVPVTSGMLLHMLSSKWPLLLSYKNAPDYKIFSKLFIYYGGNDKLWTENRLTVEEFFNARCNSTTLLFLEKADHHFHGFEDKVLGSITRWVNNANPD